MFSFGFRDALISPRVGVSVIVTVAAAGAIVGATTVPVDALSGPIPSGTVLNFGGTKTATLTAEAAAGATSLTVSALPEALVDDDTATYSGYGTAVDVNAVQMLSANVRVVTAEGEGDDEIKVVASRVIAGTMQVRMLGVDMDALSIVTGLAQVTTGAGATLINTLSLPGGHRFPNFGLVGQALEEAGDDGVGEGDELLFMPKVKVTSDITLGSFEYGAFQTVEFTATATPDGTYGIINVIERVTTGPFTLPPAGILAP